MPGFADICNFENLYKAHRAARLGKRDNREVIDFEMDLSRNLVNLMQSLQDHTYRMSGYYSFYVHDPKERKIHALHYRDRVVQHCLCDEVLAPILEKKLIYDNAACRIGKGTRFALDRVCGFLHKHYNKHGANGYFLKCDIKKFFDSIDHGVLKNILRKEIKDEELLWLLSLIIDSFEVTPGKGLPMGNQTSQWFAIRYLDGFDRMIKEQFRIKYYSRYMDDCVLIHESKEQLQQVQRALQNYLETELQLTFNEKTRVFPLKNGVEYLGFHIYITETGKVIRRVRATTKKRFKRRLKALQRAYAAGTVSVEDVKQVLVSYRGYLSYGHTYRLRRHTMAGFVLRRGQSCIPCD